MLESSLTSKKTGVNLTGKRMTRETAKPEPLTRDLGRFVAGLRAESLSPAARDVIRLGFTDLVGCMIAGQHDPSVQILRRVLAPGVGDITLFFGDERAPLRDAVFLNGTAGHALDYDDARLRGHISAALVPAILGIAQSRGASGAAMATAYAAGYETWAELVGRDPGQHHMKGWHPTGVFGAVAAAAASASLLGLDAAQSATALALGASHAGGVMANFGTMAKPYHAGRAAMSGVLAAQLAAAGFSAAEDALERREGFLAAISPEGRFNVQMPVRADRLERLPAEGVNIKKYPVCYCAHRALDAMLDLLAAHPVMPAAVDAITVRMSARNLRVLRHRAPSTALEAKFSIEFCLAAALLAGRVGLAEVSDEFVQSEGVQALMRRVVLDPDPEEDPMNGYAPFDQVTIRLVDGTALQSEKSVRARGATEMPLGPDELWRKFEDCLAYGRHAAAPRPLFDALMRIDMLGSVRDLPGLA